MNESTGRQLLAIVLPTISVAAIIGTWVVVRGSLPDRLAVNFDASGTPNNSMTVATFLAFTLGATMIAGALMVWLGTTRRTLDTSTATTLAAIGGFVAGLMAAVAVVIMVSQRNLQDWRDASDIWLLALAPILAGLAAGGAAARASQALPMREHVAAPEDRPTMSLGDQERAVWIETIRARWVAALSVVMVVVGLGLGALVSWWTALPVLIAAALVSALASVHVRADASGLAVRFGMLPWPRVDIGAHEIDHASVIDVRPRQWGGWGYRGSLKLLNQAALVYRAGPGMRVDLRNGKVFVVTLDRPEAPVALLNSQAQRTPA